MSGAPMRHRAGPNGQDRRDLLLTVAAEAFSSEGFHATTMDAIAKRAGISKPLVYEQFKSKDELFEAVVRTECERLIDHLFLAYAKALDLEPLARMRAGTAAFVDYARDHPESFKLLFQSSDIHVPGISERVEELIRTISERVADMLRRDFKAYGTPSGLVVDALATMIVGQTIYTSREMMARGSWDSAALIDLISEFQIAGLFGLTKETCAAMDEAGARDAV